MDVSFEPPGNRIFELSGQMTDASAQRGFREVSILLAKMPSGRYSISADSEGTTKRQSIQVAQSKGQRVVFIWNGAVDQ